MRRMAKNFLNILSGDIFASLLSLLSLSFITKGIGMTDYGFIILIQGISSLIDGLFNFQSWQGFIKFYPKVKRERNTLEKMIKFSYFLDLSTALVAFLMVVLLKTFIGKFYSFDPERIYLLILFSSYIPFNILGTPTGILRSYERFDLLRNQRMIGALANFILCFIGYVCHLKMGYFIVIFLGINILHSLILNFYALRILKSEGLLGFIFQKNYFDGEFFSFTLFTNINSSLDIPVQYFDTLLIGRYLSLEEVGIYKILKTIANILDRIGTPIYQILYPYFCEAIEGRASFKEVYEKFFKISSLLLLGCIGMFIGLNTIGFPLLSLFFQKVILNYRFQVNFYLLIKSIGITFIGIHPLFLSMGFIKKETFVLLLANGIYAASLLPLIRIYGLSGAIGAYGIQVFIILSLKFIFISAKKRSMLKI